MGFSVSSWNPVHLGFIFLLEYTHSTLFFMPRTGFFSLRQQCLFNEANVEYRQLIFHLCCIHILDEQESVSSRYLDTFSQYNDYSANICEVVTIFSNGDLEVPHLAALFEALHTSQWEAYFEHILREYADELDASDDESD